jgi:CheY-like chemotaxis protein
MSIPAFSRLDDLHAALELSPLGAAVLRVDQAADEHEAYAAVQARDYAAVLMDIQMPHMGGYQATRQIRALAVTDLSEGMVLAAPLHAGDGELILPVGVA